MDQEHHPVKTINVEARTHGRVLVRAVENPAAIVIGFHGYTENADIQMQRLLALPGAERWTLVSVQGLHRFYRGRTEDVVASWMTRQDREVMIADNIEYAGRVIETVCAPGVPLVTVGFSQGVAMAFRAAVRGRTRAHGIVAVGGDVPPELLADSAAGFPPALLLRGERDDWYTAAKLESDAAALRARNVPVTTLVYPAAHEWTPDVSAAVSRFVGATEQ